MSEPSGPATVPPRRRRRVRAAFPADGHGDLSYGPLTGTPSTP
ncbi:hypothetical protein KCH_22060 [Kitasatospora cheerisanensis KCTC 2395]|uniref:Uncharacterized protein n=1 Tax=Kitasatospora cheerisanensis KCTC 2395 TaxID=1348663 RepID=A0A066Z2C0_9ACTN|nr:hypothetical protein KCH_22060 [Kitasatospora cheerisanensis KCTC 2395]